MSKQQAGTATEAPAAAFSWDQVLGWRLRRQFLQQRAPSSDVLAVAAKIGGVQAQVMSSAELALWARVDDLDRRAVQTALWEDRTLVKSWAMRGTLHLFPSDDYPIWQGAASGRRHYYTEAYLKYFALSRDELDLVLDTIAEVLKGQMLSREELGAAVAERTGVPRFAESVQGSWGSILKPPAYLGNLCFAPSVDNKVRFTNPAEWLPRWQPVEPTTAKREVTRRYLSAYGPATRDELRLWWGVTARDADTMLRLLDGEIARVEIEGVPALALAKDLAEIEASGIERSIKLLPAFDQYVIAAPRDSTRVIPIGTKKLIYRNQGWLSPVLLINGQIAGVWKHERKGAKLLVQVAPFVKIPAWAKKGAEREAERLATFLGGSLELTWVGS